MYWPKKTPIIPNTKGMRTHYKSKVEDRVYISILETYPREYDEKWSGRCLQYRIDGQMEDCPYTDLKTILTKRYKDHFTKRKQVDISEDEEFKVKFFFIKI